MGEFTEPKTVSPSQPFASLKNELSTHQQAIHPELWPRSEHLCLRPVKIFQSFTQMIHFPQKEMVERE